MHELGIVFAAMDTIEDLARQNDLHEVTSVTMRLGEVSGVLLDYFEDCWRWAAQRREVLRDSKLVLQTIPAVTICHACGRTYETVRYGRVCPHCGSDQTVLVQGNEVEIETIEGR